MLSWICKKLLLMRGWQTVGQLPKLKKYVVIVAPHTSNWDFFIFLTLKFSLRLKINFIGKHTIFVWPIDWILRRLGGRPVDRNKTNNMVDAIVELFNESDQFIFALSPEGTRSYKDHWKSGFYHIAVNAGVPIQLCFLDKATKTIGFGPLLNPSGNLERDSKIIESFYQDKKGINPELFSSIKFKPNAKP